MKSDINDLCEAFLAALTNAGYAVKSIENYKQVSNRFKKFCAENGYDTYTVNIGQIFADNVFNEETGAFVGYRNVMYGRFVRLINSFYLRFLKEKKNIEDELVSFEAFTRDYVKEFIIWLKGQGASTRTINLRITSIRSFLKYCGQEDFELRGIYESVCQIQKLKEEKHPILYLQPEATAAILSAYDMNTQKHRRNRMILILLWCFTK